MASENCKLHIVVTLATNTNDNVWLCMHRMMHRASNSREGTSKWETSFNVECQRHDDFQAKVQASTTTTIYSSLVLWKSWGTPIVDVIFVLLCLKSYCSIWNLLKKLAGDTHKCMLQKALFASWILAYLKLHSFLLPQNSSSSSYTTYK